MFSEAEADREIARESDRLALQTCVAKQNHANPTFATIVGNADRRNIMVRDFWAEVGVTVNTRSNVSRLESWIASYLGTTFRLCTYRFHDRAHPAT